MKIKCAEYQRSFSNTKYLWQNINRVHADVSTECLVEPESQVKLLSPKLISPIKKNFKVQGQNEAVLLGKSTSNSAHEKKRESKEPCGGQNTVALKKTRGFSFATVEESTT